MLPFFDNPKKITVFVLAMALAISILLLTGCSATERNSVAENSSTGDGDGTNSSSSSSAAPDFTIKTLDGETVSMSDFKGQPVVLNFAASWCGPCEIEAPVLAKAYEKYQGQVVFLGVAIKDNESSQRAFAEKHGLTFPIGMDPAGNIGYSYQKAGNVSISAIPMTYFIDREGNIATYWVGPLTDSNIEMMIEAIL